MNLMILVRLVSCALMPCFTSCHVEHGVTNDSLQLNFFSQLFNSNFSAFLNNSGQVEKAAFHLMNITTDGDVRYVVSTPSSAHGPLQKKETFSKFGFSPTSFKCNCSTVVGVTQSLKSKDPVSLLSRSNRKIIRKRRSATVRLKEIPVGNTEDPPRRPPAHDQVVSCIPHSECKEKSLRDDTTMHDIIERSPCRCDVECTKYGDCCGYVSLTRYSDGDDNKSSVYFSEQREEVTCVPLSRPFHNESAYVVTSCPGSSQMELKEKCSKNVPAVNYSPLLDIPVVSKKPHVIYQNIFCAKCYDVDVIDQLKAIAECQEPNSDPWEALKLMEYQVGQLQWRNGSDRCSMNIFYEDKYIRWCPQNVVKTCLAKWQPNEQDRAEIIEDCNSRTYYVKASGVYYNNPSCVICNDVPKNLTECLNPIKIGKPSKKVKPHRLTSPFCDHSQIWNEFFETCEDPLCIYDQLSNSCTVVNESLRLISTINRPCTVSHYKRKYVVRYPNGSIFLRVNKLFLELGDYEFEGDWIATCKLPNKWTKTMFTLSSVLLSISLVCLVLHMAIFIYLPKRRNIPSMNLFSLALALFLSQLIFLCFFHYSKHTLLCITFATLLYYFLTASFLWMNVLSIDIWRTFRSSTYQIKSSKIFIQYSLYAWGVPLIPTILVVLIDRLAPKDLSIIPGFATNHCWFNNKWGHAVFFTIPAGIVVIINMFFYAFSVWGIFQQYKHSEMATSTIMQNNKQRNGPLNSRGRFETKDSSTNISPKVNNSRNNVRKSSIFITKIFSESENFFMDRIRKKIKVNRQNRLRLALYSKLALIMGMTWIFAFMSLHTKNEILEYLFIIFNGTQGTMIFIAYDCKAKIWNDLKRRLQCYHTDSFIGKSSSKDDNTRNASYTPTLENPSYLTSENPSYPTSKNPSMEYNRERKLKSIHEAVV